MGGNSKSQRSDRQLAFNHGEFDIAAFRQAHKLECSPTEAREPEGNQACRLPPWIQDNRFSRTVVGKAVQGNDARPRRHCTRVVMTTLRLVPRISALTVVAPAHVLYHL